MTDRVTCEIHGDNEATIVCAHIIETLRDGTPRGFRWLLDEDGEYQAHCAYCDRVTEKLSGDDLNQFNIDRGRIICLACFQRAAELNEVNFSR